MPSRGARGHFTATEQVGLEVPRSGVDSAFFNVTGGITWITLFLPAGDHLGDAALVQKSFGPVATAVVLPYCRR